MITATAPEQLDGRLVITVPDAAVLLGISRTHAYELVARGELPSVRLGRRVVVPTRALLDLVGGLRPQTEQTGGAEGTPLSRMG